MTRLMLGLMFMTVAACAGDALGDPAAPLPPAKDIRVRHPWAPPAKPTIPPDWGEHRAANPAPTIAYTWVNILLEATGRDIARVHAPRPTIISRQMALPLTAMYDAWADYDARAVGTRLGGKLRRPVAERTTWRTRPRRSRTRPIARLVEIFA